MNADAAISQPAANIDNQVHLRVVSNEFKIWEREDYVTYETSRTQAFVVAETRDGKLYAHKHIFCPRMVGYNGGMDTFHVPADASAREFVLATLLPACAKLTPAYLESSSHWELADKAELKLSRNFDGSIDEPAFQDENIAHTVR